MEGHMIQSINHITYSVSDIKKSTAFYKDVLMANIVMEKEKIVYFTIGDVWFALNEESHIPRNDIHDSYTHLAFTIPESEFDDWSKRLKEHHVTILQSRARSDKEGKSIYFTDPDGHKLELHTGTLEDRLKYYNDKNEIKKGN